MHIARSTIMRKQWASATIRTTWQTIRVLQEFKKRTCVIFVTFYTTVFDGDSCDPDPCVNGTCTDLVLDYRCDCDPGFSGINCSSKSLRGIIIEENLRSNFKDWNNSFTQKILTTSHWAISISESINKHVRCSRKGHCRNSIGFLVIFCSDTDPCTDALCRIHIFCRYDDRWDSCFCVNPWTGPSCASTQYSKSPVM